MGKKIIALADSSYTIRRIVELSFSEIENVEIKTYDNGSGLMEKLLDVKPQIVILDIKLPGINSYDVCKAINQSPELKSTKIYLLKGGFDPIDNTLVQQLTFEEVITKPFDSNNLVNTIMKQFDSEKGKGASLGDIPSSLPEDFSEIDTEKDASKELNFSDVKSELDAARMAMSTFRQTIPEGLPDRDDIQPSEEITQGTQTPPSKLDGIEADDDFSNPFEEPSAERRAPAAVDTPVTRAPAPMPEIPMPPTFDFSTFAPKTAAKVAEPIVEAPDLSKFEGISEEDTSELFADKKQLEEPSRAEPDEDQFPESAEYVPTAAPVGEPVFEFTAPETAKSRPKPDAAPPEPADSMTFLANTAFFPEEAEAPSFADISNKKKPTSLLTEEPDVTPVPAPTPIPTIADVEKETLRKPTPAKSPWEADLPPTPAPLSEPPPIPVGIAADDVLKKAEDKLTIAIKDLLWEIVPSLAEKIIKEEIERIKSEMNFPRT
jgi:DNA-binding response OmpR family regulator